MSVILSVLKEIFLVIAVLIFGMFYLESCGKKWQKRFGRKVQATILGIEERHHDHEHEDNECCGPELSYLLTAKANDSTKAVFEKYLWLNEKEKMEGKTQITVYVSRRNPNKYLVDLESAQ